MRRWTCICAALAALACPTPAGADARDIPVRAINAIEGRDGVRIEVVKGPAHISVEGRRPMLDRIDVAVREGVVRVRPKRSLGVFGEAPEGVVVRIAAPELSRVTLVNGAVLRGREVALGEIRAEVANGAVLTLTGTCAEGVFEAQRGGVLQAEGLACGNVTALASMGGVVRLQAQAAASARASFGGVIEVFGDPKQRALEMSFGGAVRLQHGAEKH